MATLEPVDFDPFSATPQTSGVARVYIGPGTENSGLKLEPVDHDPFKPGVAEDVAKSAGIGLVKGGIGMAGALGDLTNLGASGIEAASNFVADKLGVPRYHPGDRSKSALNAIPTSASIQGGIEGVTGEFYKPQTKYGEYAQTVGEFAPAVFGGPGSVAGKFATRVALPAVTSETAGQMTKGTAAEPYARFAGALVGGGAGALLNRPSGAAQAIRAQLPDGVTPQMVDQAEALLQRAAQQGIDLAWPEALSQVAGRPVLTNAMRHLEASPQTEAQMAEFFGNRPQQVEGAVRSQLDNIAPVNAAPSTIGPAVGRAAEETVNDVRGAINATAKPFYDKAELVRLSPQDMARVRALPGFEEAAKAVRSDPQLNRYVANLPDDSVGFLNEVKKELDRAGKAAVGPLNAQPNMQRAAGLSSDASAVKNAAVNASTDYGAALAVESVAREKYLQPLLDGPIGKLAAKDTATKKAIDVLFPKQPLANSEQEIGTAVSALAKRNPRAASDLVRAHIEGVFNEAAKDLQSGANQAGGAKFRTQLIGNPQQRLNLREAVEALPNGQERWRGFNNLLDVLEATGSRQNVGSRTAYNTELLREQSRSGLPVETAKAVANPLRGAQFLADKYERYQLGRNLGQLANILTDPRSGDLLRSIARVPTGSQQARALAIRLVTYGESARSAPVEKPNK